MIRVKNITIGRGMPKVCVPVVGKTTEEIMAELKAISNYPIDLVEWRVDYFDEVRNINAVLQVLKQIRQQLQDTPLIFTFRTVNEGGNKPLEIQKYKELYQAVIETNTIDLIDIELFISDDIQNELILLAKQNNILVILSNHDFHQTPPKRVIIERLKLAKDNGADIPKIAVMPKNPGDVLVLLDATYTMADTHANLPIVTMAMGEIGKITRTVGEVFGSAITFAAVTESSAPGQVNIEEMKKILGFFH